MGRKSAQQGRRRFFIGCCAAGLVLLAVIWLGGSSKTRAVQPNAVESSEVVTSRKLASVHEFVPIKPLPYLFDRSLEPPVEEVCSHCPTLDNNFVRLRATRKNGKNNFTYMQMICCGVCQMDGYSCMASLHKEVRLCTAARHTGSCVCARLAQGSGFGVLVFSLNLG
jgi:hypothetical protein